jgi:hypothetical protein
MNVYAKQKSTSSEKSSLYNDFVVEFSPKLCPSDCKYNY